jgi:solute carrier family 45, member 1/2/4
MNSTMRLVVSFVYSLNLAIQPVQGGMRAHFVDTFPTNQLDDSSAWATRMAGIGNLLGHGSGFVKLSDVLPFFDDAQFKVLSDVASCTLAVSIFIVCLVVHDRDPSRDGPPDHRLRSFVCKFGTFCLVSIGCLQKL